VAARLAELVDGGARISGVERVDTAILRDSSEVELRQRPVRRRPPGGQDAAGGKIGGDRLAPEVRPQEALREPGAVGECASQLHLCPSPAVWCRISNADLDRRAQAQDAQLLVVPRTVREERPRSLEKLGEGGAQRDQRSRVATALQALQEGTPIVADLGV